MKYIVELERGVWIAEMDGDPGRTLVVENAQEFDSMKDAGLALDEVRKLYRQFPNATIQTVDGLFG